MKNEISTAGVRRWPAIAGLATLAVLAATTPGTAEGQPLPADSAGIVRPTPRGEAKLIPLPSAKHFQRHVTNRYFPLKPGSKWVYEGHAGDAGERVVVRVLKRTKKINGITATVVSDRATLDGELIEKTHDWYAQDDRGRVWYLGEATKSFEDGQTSTAGSWETGVDGAKPGVVMFKGAHLNKVYAQEYLAGEAEDQGEVLSRSAQASVPTGDYDRLRLTKDTTPLEPEVMELKFYAPGVGLVLELGTSPDQTRSELVRFKRG